MADNTKAFTTSPVPNPDLMTPPCGPFPADLELFWQTLKPGEVAEKMTNFLSAEQIDALRQRGQAILDACAGFRRDRGERR